MGEAQNMPAVAAGRCVLMHLSTKTGVCSTQDSAGLSSCAAKDQMREKKKKKSLRKSQAIIFLNSFPASKVLLILSIAKDKKVEAILQSQVCHADNPPIRR